MIEPLRGLAAMSVLVFHAGMFSAALHHGGWWDPLVGHLQAGVPIFFVLSGFLLYRPFVAARADARPAPQIGRYAARRIARIVPAYWVALALVSLLPQIHLVGGPLIYFGFLQTYFPSLEVNAGIAPAWSLCVEVSFYA